jgi:beta-phosphoglucomutase
VIEAIIFDMDGTLVQTEPLKALSHARAVIEFSPLPVTEERVLEASQDLYGISEPLTAQTLMQRFGLDFAIRQRLHEFGVDAPVEAFLAVQRRAYAQMLADSEAIRRAVLPEAIAVVDVVKRDGFKVALATMSYRDQTERILDALGLAETFDAVVTEDDVERGKPDPEIYLAVAQSLGVSLGRCLVIEDTLAGVRSALAAGTWCVAVPTHLTRDEVHDADVLPERWIVDDPAQLNAVVRDMLSERAR